MPRYYFDLEDDLCAKDTEGAELADDQAAKQEASLRALNGSGHQMEPYAGYRAVVVRNESGETVFRKEIQR
jgi:hypothetical protein